LDDQVNAPIRAGTFQNPSANVRPRFRYWIPDASVDLDTVEQDVVGAKAAGAGGLEVLGYYDYGSNPGTFEPTDWATYGWGTDAWSKSSFMISKFSFFFSFCFSFRNR
jgi:hypothetical protein